MPEPPPGPVLGSNLETLFTAQNGDLWLSGDRGTACYHDRRWRTFTSIDQSAPESAQSFTELANGKIWCATRDQIWEFDGKLWWVVHRGFDRINALLRTREGSIWVAANTGLHRFFQGAWVRNGPEEGLPSADVREIYEDPRGGIWAGTARGLSLYHPEADTDPPLTSIQKAPGKENQVLEGGTITLTFTGQDKWQYTPRERLLYSYRLDEHDWSPFEPVNGVSFTDLPAGKHYFQVRAMDRNCNLGAAGQDGICGRSALVQGNAPGAHLAGRAGGGALLCRPRLQSPPAAASAAMPRWKSKSPSAQRNWRSPIASCCKARR